MSSNNFFDRCRMKLVLVSSIHLSGDISESSEEKSDAIDCRSWIEEMSAMKHRTVSTEESWELVVS